MVEHTAQILWLAHSVGHARPLSPEDVRKPLTTRALLGIKSVNTLENDCNAPWRTS